MPRWSRLAEVANSFFGSSSVWEDGRALLAAGGESWRLLDSTLRQIPLIYKSL